MSQVSTVIKERYAKDDTAKISAIDGMFELAEKLAGEGAGIVKTLLQAATVNPYLGVIASWIMADILQKAKLIYPSTNALIKTAGLIIFGVSVTQDILNVINSLLDSILPQDILKGLVGGTGGNSQPALTPFGTGGNTVVFMGDSQAIESALSKLLKVNK